MTRETLLASLKQLKETRLSWKERADLRRDIIDNSESITQDLCNLLESEEDIGFRIELLNIIGASGVEAFQETLQNILQETNHPIEILQTAATNLGKLGCGFDTLVGLLDHPSPHLRLGAIYGLGALGDERAVEYLFRKLDDDSPVSVWWPGPKAGGYTISGEASLVIDRIAGTKFRGDQELITRWMQNHLKQ
jgi:HEAT repeat protein